MQINLEHMVQRMLSYKTGCFFLSSPFYVPVIIYANYNKSISPLHTHMKLTIICDLQMQQPVRNNLKLQC